MIELPCMVDEFKRFFESFHIQLLFPVLELDSNWELKNLFLTKGFVPKTLEPQCLIRVSLPGEKIPDEEIQGAVVKFFKEIVEPRAKKLIEGGLILDNQGKLL